MIYSIYIYIYIYIYSRIKQTELIALPSLIRRTDSPMFATSFRLCSRFCATTYNKNDELVYSSYRLQMIVLFFPTSTLKFMDIDTHAVSMTHIIAR